LDVSVFRFDVDKVQNGRPLQVLSRLRGPFDGKSRNNKQGLHEKKGHAEGIVFVEAQLV
jgi:hypothetical protein